MATKGKTNQPKEKTSMGRGLLRAMLGQVISLDFFVRNWLPVLAIIVMAMVYITSKYVCQTRMEEIQRLNKELEIVKAERVRVRSEYMGRTCESSMQHMVDSLHLGLEIQERPPYRLTTE